MGVYESLVLDGLDITDVTTFILTELQVPPPPRLVEWVRSADSDGSLLAREPPADNREVTATLMVAQQSTTDLALAKIAQITDKLEVAKQYPDGISCVWTPAGGTLSVTMKVLYGEITDLPVTFAGGWFGRAPTVQLKMTCLPFLEGSEVMDLTDSFATNTIADYTADTGGGTISVSGGVLVPSSTAEKRLVHTASTYAPTDAWTGAKFLTGASVASGTAGVIAKRLDASNYLAGQIAAAGASTRVNVVKVDGGAASTLVQSGTFTLSTATNYWVRLRMEGNVATVEMFTSAPTITSTPAQTATTTLTGGDATKFGAGIAGRSGIRLIPQATDWRADDFTVQHNTTRSTEPIATLEVANIPGDAPAKIRAIVTDGATQNRRLVRVGLESRYHPTTSPPALLIDSASLVTTGYTGTSGSRTGAYSSNGVILSGDLYTYPTAICGLGNLTHIGAYRVFARLYIIALRQNALQVRLVWREGSGALHANPYVTPPYINGFAEVDLGTITIPETTLGTQRWTGQIEAYTTDTTLHQYAADIDYIALIPVLEGYGVARSPYSYTAGTLSQFDDFEASTGVLTGDALPTGSTWATSGSTTDFTADSTYVGQDPGVTTMRSTTSDTGTGRFAVAGTAVTTDTEASISVLRTTASPLTGINNVQTLLLARYVDSSNYLYASFSPGSNLIVATVVAGATTTIGIAYEPDPYTPALVNEWVKLRLVVYASGRGYFTALTAAGATIAQCAFTSTALATGGALDDGKVGFGDLNATTTAMTRYHNDFQSAIAPAEAIALHSGQAIQFRDDGMLRADSTGTYWGPPPQPNAGLRGLPPAGTRNRRARLAVMAKRNDTVAFTDDQIADSTSVQVAFTPRYLYAPR